MAPSIPPLDLRPPFAGTLGLPPRRSQLAQSSLPTVIGSPRPNVSVIYETSSNRSFVTAASAHDSYSEMDIVHHHHGHDEDEDEDDEPRVSQFRETYFNSSVDSESLTEHGDDDEQYVLDHDAPDVMLEVDLGVPPPSSTLVDRFSRDAPACLNGATPRYAVSEHSFETSTTSTAVMESRIQHRWLQGLSFGSVRFPKPDSDAKHGGADAAWRVTSAFVLFWIGFVAPWCWLIGGWYLSRSGEMEPEGQYLKTVSLHWPRGDHKDVLGLSNTARKERRWWSRHRASKESLPLSEKHPTHGTPRVTLDPWVRRCRVAAVVSGAVLCVGCVVTLIVVSGLHH